MQVRVGGTIRFKNDHRHEDSTAQESSQDRGDAPVPGLPHRQILPADAHTARILPEHWDNLWFMDFMDEETFAYGVRWPERSHLIRIHFDLNGPVPAPNPLYQGAWGPSAPPGGTGSASLDAGGPVPTALRLQHVDLAVDHHGIRNTSSCGRRVPPTRKEVCA